MAQSHRTIRSTQMTRTSAALFQNSPPLTASSVKKHMWNIEGLSGATSTTLFESLSSQTASKETSRLSLRGSTGPGLFEDDPIVLVVGVQDVEKRLVKTVSLERLLKLYMPIYVTVGSI